MVVHIDYPYHFDGSNRTAQTDYSGYVRDLIEQILFTTPGERVNRPDFGSGLLQMAFAPNSDLLGDTLQLTIQAALQQYLSDLIEVTSLSVENDEATLRVSIQYRLRRTGESVEETFVREVPGS